MKTWGIVLAAGEGARLGMGIPKAFARLGGQSLLDHSIVAFAGAEPIDQMVVVVPEGHAKSQRVFKKTSETKKRLFGKKSVDAVWAITVGSTNMFPGESDDSGPYVDGGATRQESVARALNAVPSDIDVVVVHDAARPLVTPELIERTVAALKDADGAVCAIPVSDTMKRATDDDVIETVSREGLWRIQTPQAFRAGALREAHARAAKDGFEATDDAQLIEHYGGKVVLVPGDERNIKVTTPGDLRMAEALLAEPGSRSGIGYDAHKLVEGRALVLGGVTIPSVRGLDGHSDADVLSHAITDAILGAVALGDIGEHFPSSDRRWEGAPSEMFLAEAVRRVNDAGFTISSVDATVILQTPSIAPHRDEIRKRLASVLGIDIDRVSVKASTTDKLGHIGAGDGAAAVAIARVDPR